MYFSVNYLVNALKVSVTGVILANEDKKKYLFMEHDNRLRPMDGPSDKVNDK